MIRLWRVRASESDQDKVAARGAGLQRTLSLARVKSSPALMQIVPSRRPAKGDKVQLSLKFDPDAGGCLVGQQVGTVVQDDASGVPFQARPCRAALPSCRAPLFSVSEHPDPYP